MKKTKAIPTKLTHAIADLTDEQIEEMTDAEIKAYNLRKNRHNKERAKFGDTLLTPSEITEREADEARNKIADLEQVEQERIADLKKQLTEIDLQSIRALRTEDKARLAKLEQDAVKLRNEMK